MRQGDGNGLGLGDFMCIEFDISVFFLLLQHWIEAGKRIEIRVGLHAQIVNNNRRTFPSLSHIYLFSYCDFCSVFYLHLQSSNTVFSAGLDILEMYKPVPENLKRFWTNLQDVWLKLYGSSFPTAAAINVSTTKLYLQITHILPYHFNVLSLILFIHFEKRVIRQLVVAYWPCAASIVWCARNSPSA